jgi:hypothetical protein
MATSRGFLITCGRLSAFFCPQLLPELWLDYADKRVKTSTDVNEATVALDQFRITCITALQFPFRQLQYEHMQKCKCHCNL